MPHAPGVWIPRVERIAQVSARLEEQVRELAVLATSTALSTANWGWIMGLWMSRGIQSSLILRGAMFFDVEREHTFLLLRFGKHYRWLCANELDDRRLEFYTRALYLSLVAAPGGRLPRA